MKQILKFFCVALMLVGCKNSKKEISFEKYVSAIGKSPQYIIDDIDKKEWDYYHVRPDTIEYFVSYVYSKEKSLTEYISISKCNESNTVCKITYTTDSVDFFNKIPSELKRLGFESNDENPKGNSTISEYIKSKTYNIRVVLNKVCKMKCRYNVAISFLELPIELQEIIKQKNP